LDFHQKIRGGEHIVENGGVLFRKNEFINPFLEGDGTFELKKGDLFLIQKSPCPLVRTSPSPRRVCDFKKGVSTHISEKILTLPIFS
jgi:hypothetical protein